MNDLTIKMLHAAKIKAIIKEAGLTSETVASKLNHHNNLKVTKQRFSDMINGRRAHDLELFAPQIAKILKCDVDKLLLPVQTDNQEGY